MVGARRGCIPLARPRWGKLRFRASWRGYRLGGVFTGKIVAEILVIAAIVLVLRIVRRLTMLKLLGSLPWQLVLCRNRAI